MGSLPMFRLCYEGQSKPSPSQRIKSYFTDRRYRKECFNNKWQHLSNDKSLSSEKCQVDVFHFLPCISSTAEGIDEKKRM